MLALAGLKRLGMNDLIDGMKNGSHESNGMKVSVMSTDSFIPAVAQGAIGIQCRSNDENALTYLRALNDARCELAVDVERTFLAALDGDCRTPIAGHARLEAVDGQADAVRMVFDGLISKPDGCAALRVRREGVVFRWLDNDSELPAGVVEEARRLGKDAADEVRVRAGIHFHEYKDAVNAALAQSKGS